MNLMIARRMMALAALLASIVMVACGLRSANPSGETLTIYEDAPTMTPLDLGPRRETVRATCIIFLRRCTPVPEVR